MAGPIVVSIVGDNRKLSSAVDSSQSKLSKLGGFAKGAGLAVAAGVAVAGAAVVKLGVDSVKAASDSQQSLGATQTVFGKYADTVIRRSKDAAKSIGVSANEYRELSNVVGASLTGAGLSTEKAAGLTDKLNKRAADLAATFGGKTSEAVSAFSSLLRGEADPIERYGISVKQSDVNARLAAKGQDELTGSALKQAEMQARLDLAMQQSNKTAGAFGRESGTLANRQQVLGAMFEDVKAKIGAGLLPILTRLADLAITHVIPAFERFGPPVMAAAAAFGRSLAPVLENAGRVIGRHVVPAVRDAGEKFREWQPTIMKIVRAAGDVLKALQPVAGFLAGAMIRAVTTAIGILIRIGGVLVDAGTHAVNAVKGFGQFLSGVRDKIGAAMDFIRGIPDKITGAFSGAGTMLKSIGENIINGLVRGMEAAKQWVINKIQEIADVIPGWVKKRLGIQSPSRVMAAIGVDTVRGMVVGLQAGAPGVQTAVDNLADRVEKSWKRLDVSGALKKRLPAALAAVNSEVTQLKAKAREYERVAATLQNARDKAAGIRDSALGFASVVGLGGRTGVRDDGTEYAIAATADTIAADLQAKLQALQSFTANVDALRRAGLSKDAVDQIIASGVDQGSATAAALVAGGPQAIAQVNALQGQISAAAGQLGSVAAVNMYGTGQQAAAGFVEGLEADLGKLDKAAGRIARQLVRAIKKELGIKSPSRVARDLARQFTDGIVIQTQRDAGRVSIAGKTTARAMIEGFGKPRAQLDAEALSARTTQTSLEGTLHLTADVLDQLQRGARAQADLAAFRSAGGRVTT